MSQKKHEDHIVHIHNRKKEEKKRVSCDIDQRGFLTKAQLCKLRVILGSRVLRGVYTLVKDTGR